ncbi:MAG: inactive transglutaminase family protein [Gammaproteobacteria bacterium]
MRLRNTHLVILIMTLLVIGIGLFMYRWLVLQVPLQVTATQETWVVEANLRFQAGNGPIKASFYIPSQPPGFDSLDETFISRNYGVTAQKKGPNRLSSWSIRRAKGLQSLYYRAVFYRSGVHVSPLKAPEVMTEVELSETEQFAIDAIVSDVRERSADIQTFAIEVLKILNDQNDNNAAVLMKRNYTPLNIVQQTVTVLNQAYIYAEQIRGLMLKPQKSVTLDTFIAVYDQENWIYLDPQTTQAGLAEDFLIWQYGNEPLSHVEGGSQTQFSIAVSADPVNALELAQILGDQKQSKLQLLSLFNLPVKTQYVYQILLTVPIGAFIILILRNFVGVATFGTFMPVLIALAFRETQLLTGIILFTFIVAAGLSVRFYLDQLRLLLVPRLTAILIVVVMLMLLATIFSQQFGIERGLSIALFPMVILTMVIERMCIVWDERGSTEAIKTGIGSLVAATIAYLAMRNAQLEYLFFTFPELLITLLGLVLWFGQYHGYRLSEIWRFKFFIKK